MQDRVTLNLRDAPGRKRAARLLGRGQLGELRLDTGARLVPNLELAAVEVRDRASGLAEPLPTQEAGPAVSWAECAR